MLVPALLFAFALVSALVGGRRAIWLLVALAVLLASIRGGLLVLAEDIGLSDPGLTVNALVPALVAAIVVGTGFCLRPGLADLSRPLLIGWCVIAAVALINVLVQTVGLRLYAIGLAQYLIYPTLALAVWPLMEEGDERRLARLLIAAAAIVAATVLLQAASLESFVQSANAEVDGLAADRYAGITGSYLHTSAFLGVGFVLMIGESLQTREFRGRLASTAVMALIFSGVVLTFSRSGVMISAIGAVALLMIAARGQRAILAAMVAPAIVIAVGIGALGGVEPQHAGERAASGLKTSGDTGNELRASAMNAGVERFSSSKVVEKALGDGLASTGNARQLDSGEVVVVESYFLKILTETGIVGLAAIGAFLIWAMVYFAWALWSFRDSASASFAAAGFALGLYNVIYPALETQLLALAWWLLLSLSLRRTWHERGPETRFVWRLGGRENRGNRPGETAGESIDRPKNIALSDPSANR